MTGKSHNIAGVSSYLGILGYLKAMHSSKYYYSLHLNKAYDIFKFQINQNYFAGLFLFFIGLTLPDIDLSNPRIFGNHRGITHGFIPMLTIFFLSHLYNVFYFLLLGYSLHLFYDFFSFDGLWIFYPFFKKQYRIRGNNVSLKHHILKIYRTGKLSEYIFVTFTVILNIFLFVAGFLM